LSGSIKLKHASGNGVIIAAPSSNPSSDKTINLPSDETGVFATKDSANSLQNVTGVNGGALSNRRMNINGACLVNQRGNKTGLTVSGAPHYVVDRFRHYFTEGTFSISQENDAPAGSGFTKSLKIQCTTADTSQDAGAVHNLTYPFEGQDLQRLAKGSSGAKQLAVQFWCKAYQTGAFNITLFDEDNNRFTNQTFTISASNTWEKKELIFPADTTGTITADNSVSLNLDIKLAVGTNYTSGSLQTAWGSSTTANSGVGQTVNIADNTNNNFYITGLQIEVGNVHTEFEHKVITEELALCQRYYQQLGLPEDYATDFSNTYIYRSYYLPVKQRANGTGSVVSQCRYYSGSSGANFTPTVLPRMDRVIVRGSAITNARGFLDGTIALDAEL